MPSGVIEGVDVAVTEVADQDVAAESAEGRGGRGPRPGGVHPPLAEEPLEEAAVGIEDVDESVARAGEVVMLVRLLLGEGDKELAADVVDPERRKTSRDARIGEALDQVEAAVEHLDGAESEVGRVQEGAGRRGDQCEALVN